ncbi:Selenoprotein S [Paragonimus heterotremus]|uniref:Selenoprotein S n=1 Tax=Paragonimus heterotremus TaxID=100268 RepID=A0A8J4SNK8_9TREM|nr:Selenoprotein S [Paragonimus heterotremus]
MDSTVEVEDDFGGGTTEHTQTASNFSVASFTAWVFVFILGVLYFSVKKYWTGRHSQDLHVIQHSDDALRRREAIEAARKKLQERFNEDVIRFKSKQSEAEKAKADQKLMEWEALNSGRSSGRKKTHADDTEDVSVEGGRRSKPKSRLRENDYNPLMGNTSCGGRYRPSSTFTGG